ncbi:PAS domain-containing sensor histidine kinase [Azohydromonas caseinilytica]|uniref:PAS domain S-box protein n=1 Tax=Azohydromonas caseinilytica TaxID=2728836 RepID=A0A848FC01_9BURK|nr:PAS domain S-box protein [Azohydromonas caseinilytica]NML16456.1 PAS domain S-box protein [Azohydromonas caseinilytica]
MSHESDSAEAQLAGMFAIPGVGMAQTDPVTRRFLRVNAALCAIAGYSEAELLAMTVDQLNHPEDRELDRRTFESLFRGETGYQVEKRYLRKDGAVVWVRASGNVLRDARGRPVRAFAVIEDIGQRKRGEEQLRQSEARLALIFERALVGLSEIAADGRFLRANPELGRIVGRDPGELLRIGICDVTHPQDVPPSLAAAEQVLAHGGSATLEKRYLRPDGSVVVAQSSLTRLDPLDGEAPRLLAVTVDLTALRESEARLRVITDNMPALIGYHDRQQRYVWVNEEFSRFFGVPREALLGKTMRQWLQPHVYERLHPGVEAALRGARVRFEDKEPDKYGPGLHSWTEENYIPNLAPDGSVQGFFVLALDITARKRAEEALRASEARIRAIANLVPDLLWSNDPHGRADWFNRRWCDYTGQRESEALGDGWTAVVHPDDRFTAVARWRQALRQQQPLDNELRLRSRDGPYRWHLVRAEPQLDEDGRVVRWFGSATDIQAHRSARELLEQQVRERTRELRALLARVEHVQDEERRRIARELHDSLGQYLTSLGLAVGALTQQPLEPAARERLGTLNGLLQQVDRELDRIVFTLRPTALEDCGLGDGVAAYVGTWSELSGTPVDLVLHGLDGQRLPTPVETAVFRVIQEALNNVTKHAGATRVSVSLKRSRRQLLASIEDDGVGFEQESDGSHAAPGRASWGVLGMKERIEALGGHFVLESQPGVGTTVLLRVPLDGAVASSG